MTRLLSTTVGLVLSFMIAGCTPSQEPPAAGPASSQGQPAGASGATVSSQGIVIEFRSEPDPPRSGDNAIEVTVKQADGTALTDGTVTVVFSMPAMPSMNMPAMRSDATLTHVDEGRYQGTGQLEMGGTWNVAITASRGGETVGRRNLSIVAK